MRSLIAVVAAPLLIASLAACGAPRVSYTYTKANMTQQALLEDEAELKKIHGVRQVMGKIDDRNDVRIEVFIDEKRETKPIQYLLDHGYQQVRN